MNTAGGRRSIFEHAVSYFKMAPSVKKKIEQFKEKYLLVHSEDEKKNKNEITYEGVRRRDVTCADVD